MLLNQNGCAPQQTVNSMSADNRSLAATNGYRSYVNMDLTAQDRLNMNGLIMQHKPPLAVNGGVTSSPVKRPGLLQLSQSTPSTPSRGGRSRSDDDVMQVTSPTGSSISNSSTASAAASFFARYVSALLLRLWRHQLVFLLGVSTTDRIWPANCYYYYVILSVFELILGHTTSKTSD